MKATIFLALLSFLIPTEAVYQIFGDTASFPSAEVSVKRTITPIILAGPVTDESVLEIQKQIIEAVINKSDAIVLKIDSGGGSVDAGIGLSRMMEASPVPIHCVVDGDADSMAFYILQACTTRAMTTRSSLMIHEPSITGMISGNAALFHEIANRLDTLAFTMAEHEAKRMNITAKELRNRIANRNWWLNYPEAMKYKAVDYVAVSVVDVIQALEEDRPPIVPSLEEQSL